jgi:hypothetical protein
MHVSRKKLPTGLTLQVAGTLGSPLPSTLESCFRIRHGNELERLIVCGKTPPELAMRCTSVISRNCRVRRAQPLFAV